MKGDTIHLLTAPSSQQMRRYFHVKSVLDPGSAAGDPGLNLFGLWVCSWGLGCLGLVVGFGVQGVGILGQGFPS